MEYEIRGSAGNAFAILGTARQWAEQWWPEDWRGRWATIEGEATAGDYDHLLDTNEAAFRGSVRFTGRDDGEGAEEGGAA